MTPEQIEAFRQWANQITDMAQQLANEKGWTYLSEQLGESMREINLLFPPS